mmetsp:Transcript_3638/g.7340  ORF Transcript_3638/g.7340 Transcript_3638/m.7340 type:complete len:756 (-) Transcript_3638:76-2343(-)|eukprot:CAMPEP_0118647862 /NCGR_PEP_ID=MMETSP0785-20121206/8840_1 /TAXON_ID=91992 /ORGANISM="Bolidomonas pacifica, Strain CCMP 1866" /LENGTH=755 /DNA_ID=CAMNT_0006539999 /DNA_START=488 /DNA_END=2755 /DNA_ORIENTATION=+
MSKFKKKKQQNFPNRGDGKHMVLTKKLEAESKKVTTEAMREAKKIKGYNPVRQHKGVAYLRDKKSSMTYTNPNPNGFLTKPRKDFVSNPSKLVPVQDMPWVHSKKLTARKSKTAHSTSPKSNSEDDFSSEILRFATYVIPNYDELIVRNLLIAKVTSLIVSHNQVGGDGVEVRTFGSYASMGNVGLYSSDVDMIVEGAVEKITNARMKTTAEKEKKLEDKKKGEIKLDKWRKIVGGEKEDEKLQDYEEMESEEEKKEEKEKVKKKEPQYVEGSSSDEDSDGEGISFEIDRGGDSKILEDTGGDTVEVHMSSRSPTPTKAAIKPAAPPPPPVVEISKKEKDALRKDVVKTLRAIAKKIASCRWCDSIECRAKAKVPIVNFVTSFGVEGDVGCGGAMGVDTSDYSTKLVEKFNGTFEPLVLLLKYLLSQGDLDKPFTGGIGSFKLYVMIANHLEAELTAKKGPKPPLSRLFVSFLERYQVGGDGELGTGSVIRACGAVADFKGNFRIGDVSSLFSRAWVSIKMCIKAVRTGRVKGLSYLACLVDHAFLRRDRNTSIRKAQKAISTDVMDTKNMDINQEMGKPHSNLRIESSLDEKYIPNFLKANPPIVPVGMPERYNPNFTFKHPGKPAAKKPVASKPASKKRARAADLIDSPNPVEKRKRETANRQTAAQLPNRSTNPQLPSWEMGADELAQGYGFTGADDFYRSTQGVSSIPAFFPAPLGPGQVPLPQHQEPVTKTYGGFPRAPPTHPSFQHKEI